MSLHYRFQISPPFAPKSDIVAQRPVSGTVLRHQNQADIHIALAVSIPLGAATSKQPDLTDRVVALRPSDTSLSPARRQVGSLCHDIPHSAAIFSIWARSRTDGSPSRKIVARGCFCGSRVLDTATVHGVKRFQTSHHRNVDVAHQAGSCRPCRHRRPEWKPCPPCGST